MRHSSHFLPIMLTTPYFSSPSSMAPNSPNRHLHWHLIHLLHYRRWRHCLQMICLMNQHHHSHPIACLMLIWAGDVFWARLRVASTCHAAGWHCPGRWRHMVVYGISGAVPESYMMTGMTLPRASGMSVQWWGRTLDVVWPCNIINQTCWSFETSTITTYLSVIWNISCARLLTCHNRIIDEKMAIIGQNSWQVKMILKQRNGVVVPDNMSVYDAFNGPDGLRKRAQRQWRPCWHWPVYTEVNFCSLSMLHHGLNFELHPQPYHGDSRSPEGSATWCSAYSMYHITRSNLQFCQW